MRLIKAGYEIVTKFSPHAVLQELERVGRVCYKSEDRTTFASASNFIRNLVARGHHAIIEHFNISVKFTVDRGVSHEIVRHRLASYAQESTRYCNYHSDRFDKQCTFIIPCWSNLEEGVYEKVAGDWYIDDKELFYDNLSIDEIFWLDAIYQAEKSYFELIDYGWTPQQARSVLPNSLKTELFMTANLREWKHFFNLRADIAAHPQMREVAIPLEQRFIELLPEIYEK